MNVTANGILVPLENTCNLEEFLILQGLLPRSVVVEYNGEAIPPSQFCSVVVKDGDRLEIVKIVAGG